MGIWSANFLLQEGHKILLIGRKRERLAKIQNTLNVEISDRPESVTGADIVLFSVPISSFESVIVEYSPYLQSTQTIVEITSVKTVPISTMHNYLRTKKILSIHPMFGPGAQDMSDHNYIITPTNDIENELAAKARENKISLDDLTGGTFTITNGGTFGSMLSTPILNPPQSAILGMHKIMDRPMAVNGKIEIRPMMYLALSYDHRIIDGRESVGFLVRVKELLENPEQMLFGKDPVKALLEL